MIPSCLGHPQLELGCFIQTLLLMAACIFNTNASTMKAMATCSTTYNQRKKTQFFLYNKSFSYDSISYWKEVYGLTTWILWQHVNILSTTYQSRLPGLFHILASTITSSHYSFTPMNPQVVGEI